MAALLLLGLALFLVTLCTGKVQVPLSDIVAILTGATDLPTEWITIVMEFRLPKAITSTLIGVALSVSGLQMQTIFRNPLAGPYVLGISAGASLGVALVIMGAATVGIGQAPGNLAIVSAACVGALAVLLLIFSVSLRIRDVMTILILGIMLGSITSSFINVLQYFSNASLLKIFTVWTMGSLDSVTSSQLMLLAPCVAAGWLMALTSIKSLNVLALGENYARSLGVHVWRSRLIIFCSTGILAGSATAFCGPIGFVGIVVPHICRLLFRTADQRTLLAASTLAGAVVMLLSDLIAMLPANAVLPINSVTAFIGIPVIIWIVIRNHRMSSLM